MLFHCVAHSLSLSLSSCLGCIPLLVGLRFLRSRLRMFFLALRVLRGSICFFCFCLCLCFCFSVFLIYFIVLVSSVSLPGDDVFCWLLSCPFHYVCFPRVFFSDGISVWTWFGFAYLVTTAGFVADQLM